MATRGRLRAAGRPLLRKRQHERRRSLPLRGRLRGLAGLTLSARREGGEGAVRRGTGPPLTRSCWPTAPALTTRTRWRGSRSSTRVRRGDRAPLARRRSGAAGRGRARRTAARSVEFTPELRRPARPPLLSRSTPIVTFYHQRVATSHELRLRAGDTYEIYLTTQARIRLPPSKFALTRLLSTACRDAATRPLRRSSASRRRGPVFLPERFCPPCARRHHREPPIKAPAVAAASLLTRTPASRLTRSG